MGAVFSSNPETPTADHAGASKELSKSCAICIEDYTKEKPIYLLPKCMHDFHKHCIKESFKKMQPQCPVCKTWYGTPKGNMPKGAIMSIRKNKGLVDGFDCTHYYSIRYTVPSGIQTAKHPHPGVPFTGTVRTAYIPDTEHGRQMLALLRIAFKRKLTFTMGDSVTSGAKNMVTWNNIHHKTNLNGGSHWWVYSMGQGWGHSFGFPDPEYLNRLEDELKSMGITKHMIKKWTCLSF